MHTVQAVLLSLVGFAAAGNIGIRSPAEAAVQGSYTTATASVPSYPIETPKEHEWEHKEHDDKPKEHEWEHKEHDDKDKDHDKEPKEWEHKWDSHEWSKNKTTTASTTTKTVSHFTTYCPEPTTITVNKKTYTVTKATTLTITDCPCTVVEPCPTETAKPPHDGGKWDHKDWDGKKPEDPKGGWDGKKPEDPKGGWDGKKPEDPKGGWDGHHDGDKPKPPPVVISGASQSLVHVGAAVFGALLVGVMAL